MDIDSGGTSRSPLDIVFFVVCFFGVLFIAAGLITGSIWATVFGFLLGFVGLGHFLISGWL
jgi:hypothetical protein